MNMFTKHALLILMIMTPPTIGAMVYTDSASFLSNVDAGVSFNDFSELTQGSTPASLSYTIGDFSYDITSSSGSFFNGPGFVSSAGSDVIVNFTSGNVTAIGGNFWGAGRSFGSLVRDMVITLSDGTTVSFTSAGSTEFRGFTSDLAITSMNIHLVDGLRDRTSLDNFYVGTTVSVVPLPSAAWAAFGTFGLLGGVRIARRRS